MARNEPGITVTSIRRMDEGRGLNYLSRLPGGFQNSELAFWYRKLLALRIVFTAPRTGERVWYGAVFEIKKEILVLVVFPSRTIELPQDGRSLMLLSLAKRICLTVFARNYDNFLASNWSLGDQNRSLGGLFSATLPHKDN